MNIEVNDIALPANTLLRKRYEIREVYYLGHIGIVYFGWDHKKKKEIAIKEFMPYMIANRDMDGIEVVCKGNAYKKQFENASVIFGQECNFVWELRNVKKPYDGCILKYIDCFQDNGTFYLITERIKGKSLQEYIENGEDFSVRGIMQMLVAIVRQIHRKGIAHCDIKPSNIIVREDGKIVLIDFGSACYWRAREDKMQFVSRGYSAPELYNGGLIDNRTDIYSIGAVLYYLLTDYQLPGPDESGEQEAIPPLSDFIEIPKKLEKIILRTLNQNKKKRPKSLLLLQHILNQ